MPPIISMQNKIGFTLIEVLVAIVIMMVSLLGLLQAVNIAIEYNFRNQQRAEVVRVGEKVMNEMRAQPFGAFHPLPYSDVISEPSNIRARIPYSVNRSVFSITTSQTDQYRVDVKYKYKNFSTNHSVVTLRGK